MPSDRLQLPLLALCTIVWMVVAAPVCPCNAADILVVQTMRVKPLDDAFRGLIATVSRDVERVALSEPRRKDILRVVREEKPRVVVAIGSEALCAVRKVRHVPVVALMALNIAEAARGSENITGVSMMAAPERQLSLFSRMLPPALRRIGVVYDPNHSRAFVRQAHAAARAAGYEVVPREVRSPREIPSALRSLQGGVDMLWMLPDPTVVTPETTEYFLIHALQSRLPVITFSSKYMNMGALLALDVDPREMGRQAGELVAKILSGVPVAEIPVADARSIECHINTMVAGKLGLALRQPPEKDTKNR